MLGVDSKAPDKALAPRVLIAYGLAKAIPGVLMLASVPLWVRLYGAANYGTFTVLWGAVLFSASLGTGWLRQSGLKYAGSSVYRLGHMPRTVVVLSVLVSGIPPALLVMTLPNPENDSRFGLAVASITFALASAVYYLALSVAQRDQHAGRFTLAETIRSIVTLGASLIMPLLLGSYSGTTLILANVLGTLAGLTVLPLTSNRKYRKSRDLNRPKIVLRAFWTFGWPMGIWQAVAAATLYSDRFFLTVFLGADAAGGYAAIADLLVRGFTILAYPIVVAGHPAIMLAWNTGRRSQAVTLSDRWTSRLACITAVGVVGSVFACLLFGEWLLGTPVQNVWVLCLLALGAGCWQLSLMTHKGLEMVGRPRAMLGCLSLLVVMSVVMNILFIPLWGTTVAAAGFCFAATFYCGITYYLSKRALKK